MCIAPQPADQQIACCCGRAKWKTCEGFNKLGPHRTAEGRSSALSLLQQHNKPKRPKARTPDCLSCSIPYVARTHTGQAAAGFESVSISKVPSPIYYFTATVLLLCLRTAAVIVDTASHCNSSSISTRLLIVRVCVGGTILVRSRL